MSQTRRQFLKNSSLLSTSLLTAPAILEAAELLNLKKDNYTGEYPIHQGLTFSDTAYFSVLRPIKIDFSYEVVDSQNQRQSLILLKSVCPKGAQQQLDKLKVNHLELGKKYKFRVINAVGRIVDERDFTTLDPEMKKPKISVASCMNDIFKSAALKMWSSMEHHKPDLVFLVGDTSYADNDSDGTELGFFNRYVDTRLLLGIFRQKRLVPILAVWDDHDFGGNDADQNFSKKKITLKLFHDFWIYPDYQNGPNAEYKVGLGVSQVFSAFGQRFFLMDCRYFRSSQSQWGSDQTEQLMHSLSTSHKPAWLMNGSQFFGGYMKKDAYEYHQGQDLKLICQQLSRIDAPVCFVSGDVHFSELMQIESQILGYKTFEITSSSIHSYTFLGYANRRKNPRRIVATSKHNYNIIEIDNSSADFKFTVAAYNDDCEVIYKRPLQIVR